MKRPKTTDDKNIETTHKILPVSILRKFSPKNKMCSEFDETWYTYQLNHAENDSDIIWLIDTCHI